MPRISARLSLRCRSMERVREHKTGHPDANQIDEQQGITQTPGGALLRLESLVGLLPALLVLRRGIVPILVQALDLYAVGDYGLASDHEHFQDKQGQQHSAPCPDLPSHALVSRCRFSQCKPEDLFGAVALPPTGDRPALARRMPADGLRPMLRPGAAVDR